MGKRVVITGSTGMVGKGVLLECLDHPDIEKVLVVNRSSLGLPHQKLEEILVSDFMHVDKVSEQLAGYDACFFCLGVSSVGMSEEDYTRVTYDLTMNFAKLFLKGNPEATFMYVSGTGTDSTESSSTMWKRVKGKTENALLSMDFKKSYMFRPGYIQPMKGIRSKTALYDAIYQFAGILYPILRLFPNAATTSVNVRKAMIKLLDLEYDKKWLENDDINQSCSAI
jgi:nucleoside-diphosphate-sugar epimerase